MDHSKVDQDQHDQQNNLTNSKVRVDLLSTVNPINTKSHLPQVDEIVE